MSAKPKTRPLSPHLPLLRRPDRAAAAIELLQDLGLLLVIALGAIALSFLSPVFFSRLNIENLLFSSTIVAVIAIGETFVILVAGIDLSVGAVLALSSVLAVGLVNDYGVPPRGGRRWSRWASAPWSASSMASTLPAFRSRR